MFWITFVDGVSLCHHLSPSRIISLVSSTAHLFSCQDVSQCPSRQWLLLTLAVQGICNIHFRKRISVASKLLKFVHSHSMIFILSNFLKIYQWVQNECWHHHQATCLDLLEHLFVPILDWANLEQQSNCYWGVQNKWLGHGFSRVGWLCDPGWVHFFIRSGCCLCYKVACLSCWTSNFNNTTE